MTLNLEVIYGIFPTKRDCVRHLEKWYWQGKPICPYCNKSRSSALENEGRHHCNSCHTTFSVTVNTPFHHSRLPLQKWFWAISMMVNTTTNFTVRYLANELHISKNTAWFLSGRIKAGMLDSKHRQLFIHLASFLEG